MRYYRLILANTAGQVYVPNAAGGFSTVAPGANVSTFTSHLPTASGGLQYNPGSLNVEFDAQVVDYAVVQANPLIRISGVGLTMIGRAADFNFTSTGLPTTTATLYAGMQQGIAGPNGLANPTQARVLFQGNVFQGFGNWQGVNQSIDLIIINGPIVPPGGISWNWQPGTPLASALFTTLQQAFPTYQVSVNIAAGLYASSAQGGCYQDFTAFASALQLYTQPLGSALKLVGYTGVRLVVVGQSIRAFDNTIPINPIQLNFQDLIGQPTWIDVASVNFKTVLRGDIHVGDQVIFPTGVIAPYALTSPNAAVPGAPARSKTVFQSPFRVTTVHHFANYRQPDADSWNTTFDAVATVPVTP